MAKAGREVAANDWDYPEVGTARKTGTAASFAPVRASYFVNALIRALREINRVCRFRSRTQPEVPEMKTPFNEKSGASRSEAFSVPTIANVRGGRAVFVYQDFRPTWTGCLKEVRLTCPEVPVSSWSRFFSARLLLASYGARLGID